MSNGAISRDGWILMDKMKGHHARRGDRYITFRGEQCVLEDGTPPAQPTSTGRVIVRLNKPGSSREFYPAVINCEWVKQ